MAKEESESPNDLLKHFDDELAQILKGWLSDEAITTDHVKEIIRLTSVDPRYRDPEAFESLLEDAEEMDAEAFREWVAHSIEEGNA